MTAGEWHWLLGCQALRFHGTVIAHAGAIHLIAYFIRTLLLAWRLCMGMLGTVFFKVAYGMFAQSTFSCANSQAIDPRIFAPVFILRLLPCLATYNIRMYSPYHCTKVGFGRCSVQELPA